MAIMHNVHAWSLQYVFHYCSPLPTRGRHVSQQLLVDIVVIWEVSKGPTALVTVALNHLPVQLLL